MDKPQEEQLVPNVTATPLGVVIVLNNAFLKQAFGEVAEATIKEVEIADLMLYKQFVVEDMKRGRFHGVAINAIADQEQAGIVEY